MKIRVLLVDDEKEFTDILAERLEARGVVVSSASNGDEALELVNSGEFDVVVLDVMMPGKDGIAVLREMKLKKPLVEVIMLTGHATVQTAVEGMRQGAFEYLMKPTDSKDLLEKIVAAYKRKAEQEDRIRNAEIQRIMLTRGWD